MSTTTENVESRRHSFRLPLTLLIVGLVYLFSVGPVLTTADRFKFGSTVFYQPLRAIYAPVFVVARSSDICTRIYEGYLGFWCRIILKQEYQQAYPTDLPSVPVEGVLASIGSITNGESSFQVFVPNLLSQGGVPTSQDVAMALIVGKVREHGLYPAGYKEQASGKLYTFEREREWERKKQ